MAEAPQLILRKVDLTKDIPSDFTVVGLSKPKFDGVNYFRTPEALFSELTFATESTQFVEFQYQLYSPKTSVEGDVFLDGRRLGAKVFSKGKFDRNHELGTFISSGIHSLVVKYSCNSIPCKYPISQYWTQIIFVKPSRSIESVGLNVKRYWADTLNSPLTTKGTSGLLLDGNNYFEYIKNDSFELHWYGNVRPLNVHFRIYASEAFKVVMIANEKTIFSENGNARDGVSANISLVGLQNLNKLTVKIICPVKKLNCSRLYSPRIDVLQEATRPSSSTWFFIILLALLLIVVAAYLLNLFPKRRNHA